MFKREMKIIKLFISFSFETGPHVNNDGFQLPVFMKITLNFHPPVSASRMLLYANMPGFRWVFR